MPSGNIYAFRPLFSATMAYENGDNIFTSDFTLMPFDQRFIPDFSIEWDSTNQWAKLLMNTADSFKTVSVPTSNPNAVLGVDFSNTPYVFEQNSSSIGYEVWIAADVNVAPVYVPILGGVISSRVQMMLYMLAPSGDIRSINRIILDMAFKYDLVVPTILDGSLINITVENAEAG